MFRDHLWGINCPRNLTLKVGFSPYLNKACNDWNLKLLLQLRFLKFSLQCIVWNPAELHKFRFNTFICLNIYNFAIKRHRWWSAIWGNLPKLDKYLPWQLKTYFELKGLFTIFSLAQISFIDPFDQNQLYPITIQNVRFEI